MSCAGSLRLLMKVCEPLNWKALVGSSPRYNLLRRDYWFGQVDTRPLSLFRIAFGLILLKDALYHLPLADVFYSDTGVVPRRALLEVARADRFSLMDAMPHAWMATLFFLLWVAVALGLVFGFRTRLMTVLNFVIVMSVHERNVYVLTGADTIMRNLSFWMMFIPLGHYYSLDARRARLRGRPLGRTGYAFPLRLMQLQVALVYLFTGILKTYGAAWLNGSAMFYVMQLDAMLLPTGYWFRGVAPDWLLSAMTYFTLAGELLFPLLVFAPVGQPLLRLLGLAFGVLLHLGIGALMSIPDFSAIMISSYIIFLQPEWVEAGERRLRAALRLPPPLPLIEAAPTTSTGPKRARRAAATVAASLAMAGIVWWNLATLDNYGGPVVTMPVPVRSVMWYAGIWQYWDMFAPFPIQVDGWYTVPARFEDGTELDLRTGQPPNDDLQRVVFGPFARWEKFEENMYNNPQDAILLAWGQLYCREYNTRRALPEGRRLATLEIVYRYRRSHAPGQPRNDLTDHLLWRHWCYDQYAS